MSLTEEFSRHDNSTVLMWLIKIRGSSSEEETSLRALLIEELLRGRRNISFIV